MAYEDDHITQTEQFPIPFVTGVFDTTETGGFGDFHAQLERTYQHTRDSIDTTPVEIENVPENNVDQDDALGLTELRKVDPTADTVAGTPLDDGFKDPFKDQIEEPSDTDQNQDGSADVYKKQADEEALEDTKKKASKTTK